MPYIITTIRPQRRNPDDLAAGYEDVRSRRAVATLDEARERARTIVQGQDWERHTITLGSWCASVRNLGESGGTIGPLPDGTVIEVERAHWYDIAVLTIHDPDKAIHNATAAGLSQYPGVAESLLTAFNEVQQ
jgi:hypothetical protein